MSNFSFIPPQWADIAQTPQEAEQHVYGAPLYAAMLCRKSLEQWVRWMYAHDEDLSLPHDTSLSSLIHEQCFKQVVAPMQFNHINLIRKLGNTAVHSNAKLKPQEALYALQLLHGFIGWVTIVYSEERPPFKPFDEAIIPREGSKDKSKEELQQLERAFHAQQSELKKLQDELAAIKALKDQNIAFIPPPVDPNEDLTRKLYIDTLLREAGWDLDAPRAIEYPVLACMPTAKPETLGDGRVDYVLWGNDGLPLALVEAKRTRRDPREGQHQAWLYANCLEKEFKRRPIIFFSNGFDTWLWDDTQYQPRKVQGFYTRDELEWMHHRRKHAAHLEHEVINNAITDRGYQHLAIRSVTEALMKHRREALLVMATGTGKTRVAASIIDLLSKAGWVKRVLFLADRNALIHQAKINLNTYLPHLPSVDLTREKEDESSRIVFSTYQTMINCIDGEMDGGTRKYGVGYFDLIIFDEIHRSVYNRYRYILEYFDGIRLGLTATPRAEGDRDTYELFNLEPNIPTFAYELDEAVNSNYLVPPKAISVPLKFQREGIRYADLKPEERLRYEETFADPITGEYPDEINSSALNTWLFNTDTVDKVIAHLMEHGVKVQGGDVLAKTIIFARSHDHALFIQERFNKQYPQYKGLFLRVIDYKQEYKYDLLNAFKEASKYPQIAVSVDMLDTGIDVPEVCNLVFFKPVRSYTKFWQMVGRGTRLCKDLFGLNEDKTHFIIFDFCENLEYFQLNPKGIDAGNPKSLSARLFEVRLKLMLHFEKQLDENMRAFATELKQYLIQQVQALSEDTFMVRRHWATVVKFKDAAQWNSIGELDTRELLQAIAPLVSEGQGDEAAKRFDLLMYELLWSLHGQGRQLKQCTLKLCEIGHGLMKKTSIPLVASQREYIEAAVRFNPATDGNVSKLEHIRIALRHLMQFLDKEMRLRIQSSFEDTVEQVQDYQIVNASADLKIYRERVNAFIQNNRHHLTIDKLRKNIPITRQDLEVLENMLFQQGNDITKERLEEVLGEYPLGSFIRSVVGMEAEVVQQALNDLLKGQTLNTRQIRFIETIVRFLASRGKIYRKELFEAPFTDLHDSGMLGLFTEEQAGKILQFLDGVDANAQAG